MKILVHKIIRPILFIEIILLIMNFFPAKFCGSFLPVKWCFTIQNLFDLELESNIPTWFSTLLLFSIALASLIIYDIGKKHKNAISLNSFWLLFSIVFFFLSLDEAMGLHEMITSGLNIEWIWIYAPLGIIFFILCTYFFEYVNKNKELTDWILGGMIIFSLGIITSEVFSSYVDLGKAKNAIEEGFEMLGSIMILTGCLKELNRSINLK